MKIEFIMTSFFILCLLLMSKLCHCKNTRGTSPYVRISPSGKCYVLAGEQVNVSCKGVNMNVNSKISLYNSDGVLQAVSFTSSLNNTVRLDKNTTSKQFYCLASVIVDGEIISISSGYLSLNVKMGSGNRTAEEIIIEPPLNNVTLYRSGDNFFHTCKGRNMPKITNLSWTKIKGSQNIPLNNGTAVTELSLDTVLTKQDNNSILQCTLSYYDKGLEIFIDKKISTVLILEGDTQVGSFLRSLGKYPNYLYVLSFILGKLMLIITIGVKVFRRRRSKPAEKLYVEVQNELYGACSDVVYAQVYSSLKHYPVPPREPLECAGKIGNYQPKK